MEDTGEPRATISDMVLINEECSIEFCAVCRQMHFRKSYQSQISEHFILTQAGGPGGKDESKGDVQAVDI